MNVLEELKGWLTQEREILHREPNWQNNDLTIAKLSELRSVLNKIQELEAKAEEGKVKCHACHGSGAITTRDCYIFDKQPHKCPVCDYCTKCNGTGEIKDA